MIFEETKELKEFAEACGLSISFNQVSYAEADDDVKDFIDLNDLRYLKYAAEKPFFCLQHAQFELKSNGILLRHSRKTQKCLEFSSLYSLERFSALSSRICFSRKIKNSDARKHLAIFAFVFYFFR